MTESYKMIKMYLKIQDIFTRLNEFLPDMSGGQKSFVKTVIRSLHKEILGSYIHFSNH